MDSVALFVRDAVGVEYLHTYTDNTPENVAKFRKHVAWWKRYVRSPAGRKAYNVTAVGQPCFPVTTHVEPYDSKALR